MSPTKTEPVLIPHFISILISELVTVFHISSQFRLKIWNACFSFRAARIALEAPI